MKLLKYALASGKGHFVFRADEFRCALDIEGKQVGSVEIQGQTHVSICGGQGAGITPIVTAEQVMKDVKEALAAKEQA